MEQSALFELFQKTPNGYIADQPFWYITVSPRELKFFHNYRKTYNEAKLKELTDNIAGNGLISEPLAFERNGKIYVLAGHRRTLACLRIIRDNLEVRAVRFDPTKIRVKIFRAMADELRIRIQISENLSDKPDPADEAVAIYELWTDVKRSKAYKKITVSEFARLIEKPETTVRNALHFIDGAHPKILDAVHRKVITYSSGQLLTRIADTQAQLSILQLVTAEDRVKSVQEAALRPYVNEWIWAHSNQEVLLFTDVKVVDHLEILRQKLSSGVSQNYYRAIHWYDTIVKGSLDGLLPKKLFTKSHLAAMVRATEVHEELQLMIGASSSVHFLARRVAGNCKICPVEPTCTKSLGKTQCVNAIALWSHEQVALQAKAKEGES